MQGISLFKHLLIVIGLCASPSGAFAEDEKRKPNKLLGVQSPYLQQHVYNPVNWYPWGEEALTKAQRENKPIFLSVGYSTCHWCHVMAAESFEDEAIGAFLNEHYVAIKVDRERRPDLDEQFMLATQAITGQGGWPNSVFLTPDAKPFYAATYMPPNVFMNALSQIDQMWETERATLQQEGDRISSGIMSYMNRTEAAQVLTPGAIKTATDSILDQVDYFSGGLGAAPKFPQETAMLLLLDQARRGNRPALDAVKGALDGMLMGGIHDHVGGGFHRYSVDANWLVPHFEKMLYNQAMIGRLLIDTYELTGEYRYKHTAVRLLDYVIREMQSPDGGYFSAQDADSLSTTGVKGEGHFYIWSKSDIEDLNADKFGAVQRAFQVTEKGHFEGHNILHLTERVDQIVAGGDQDEVSFYARLDEGLDALRILREQHRSHPHKDEKILVSWNAMMIDTMVRAARVFDRPDYWRSARASARYMLDNMLRDEGLLRVSYEGRIGVEGQLADYASLGTALLTLSDFTPDGEPREDHLETVLRLAQDLRTKFGQSEKPEDLAFLMTHAADGMGNFAPLDDNPIPSGNSLALQLFNALAQREGLLDYKQRSFVFAATMSGFALASPQSRGTLLNETYAINTEQVGNLRHVANGNVRVDLMLDHGAQTFDLKVAMKPGWHINSNKPLEKYFIPTLVQADGVAIANDAYPTPLEKTLKFNGKPLSLYEGQMRLTGPLPKSSNPKQPNSISLDLQACSDEICLEPETLVFNYWPAKAR